jgi:hypothetical protein
MHSLSGCFSATLFIDAVNRYVPSVQDAAIRLRLKAVVNFSTSKLEVTRKLSRQADWALGSATDHLPLLVCEVSFGQSFKGAKAKAIQYLKSSNGKIRTCIIFDIDHPKAKVATVSMVTADESAENGCC